MRRLPCHLIIAAMTLSAAGCALTTGSQNAAKGRKTFAALQAAVAEVSSSAKDTVALVKLKGMSGGNSRRLVMSGGRLRQSSAPSDKTVTAVILTTNGYAVIAQSLKPQDVTRLEVWIGDSEYSAKIVKGDEQLGMTIIKIDADEPLKTLDLKDIEDLRTGDWCVSVQPSDEDYDFEQFTYLSVCRGEIAGLYREFMIDSGNAVRPGAPVLSLDGRMVGIIQRSGRVLAMSDLSEDLTVLLNESAGVKSADEEARQKGWFGALVKAVNKDYARKHGLNKSSLHVQHVMKDGPADKAGVKAGDMVTRVNGRDMRLTGQRAYKFFQKALHPKVDQPFSITVIRDGKELALTGTFAKRPEPETLRADDLGVTVKKIEDADAAMRNLFSSEGVLVTEVKKGSAAAVGSSMRNSLLTRGDIITAVGETPTPNLETFSAALEKLRRERPDILLITYMRGRTTGFAALNLKIGDNGDKGENQ